MEIESLIMDIVDRASKSIEICDDDYYNPSDNGLLYCGKCNTRKQTIKQMPFGEIRPLILCQCAKAAEDKKDAERKSIEFQDKVKRNQNNCFSIGTRDRMLTKRFGSAEDCKLVQVGRKYVENFPQFLKDGKGLLFCGGTGTGKSFTAACICNALLEKGYACRYTNFATLRSEFFSADDKQDFTDSLNKNALIVIDDLGAESKTEYMSEIVHNVIDSRVNAGLPIVVTTNLTKDELVSDTNISQKRIFSRLYELCVFVDASGMDRRKQEMVDTAKKYKDILGL